MNPLFVAIETFYERLHRGEFDLSEYSLAVELQKLADRGWDKVDQLLSEAAVELQSSLKID